MAYCDGCKKDCELISEDVGIGSYEFWGACGNDVQMAVYSDCCGELCFNKRFIESESGELEEILDHLAIRYEEKSEEKNGLKYIYPADCEAIEKLMDLGIVKSEHIVLMDESEYEPDEPDYGDY